MTSPLTCLITQLMRLNISSWRRGFHIANTLSISSSSVLSGPKSKTSALTPAIRERKKKKLEKELRILAKAERILKPLEEYELPLVAKKDLSTGIRARKPTVYSNDELDTQVLLMKDWSRYKMMQHLHERKIHKRLQTAQNRALEKLREESEDLYQQAIKLDEALIHFMHKGPSDTPPKPGYDALDGEYIDETNYFHLKNI